MNETRMARAWKAASADLGFEFISPYTFTDNDGKSYTCSGFLPHFGCNKGTLIISGPEDPDADAVDDAGVEIGYYSSGLNPRYYHHYKRQLWVDTLCDWGWFGPIELPPPDWFQDLSNG